MTNRRLRALAALLGALGVAAFVLATAWLVSEQSIPAVLAGGVGGLLFMAAGVAASEVAYRRYHR